MSLHGKHEHGKASEVIHSARDISTSVPKYKIPRDERSARDAYALIHDELLLDGNSRQNLATFCTTCESKLRSPGVILPRAFCNVKT